MGDLEPSLPDIRLANLLELPDGRTVEWEVVGRGEPLPWIEGGPGFPAELARPDIALIGCPGVRSCQEASELADDLLCATASSFDSRSPAAAVADWAFIAR